ncbi:MAG TPA: YdeI/OmpD-associated family protein [Candidatus Paceibacterota bacterium]
MASERISGGTAHTLPADIRRALARDSKARTLWETLTPLARNEWICWVITVQKADTRAEHLKRLLSELKEGVRRPCCWMGCVHRTDKAVSPSVRGILEKRSAKRRGRQK